MMNRYAIALVAALWLVATPAIGQVADLGYFNEDSTLRLTMSGFVDEAGDPVVPTSVTYAVYKLGGSPTTAGDIVIAPTTLTNPADFTTTPIVVKLPHTTTVLKGRKAPELQVVALKWTWAGGDQAKRQYIRGINRMMLPEPTPSPTPTP